VLAGILILPRSRLGAYEHFRTSVQISILLTEFFAFLQVQFAALPGFAINLLILLALSELIEQERELAVSRQARAAAAQSARSPRGLVPLRKLSDVGFVPGGCGACSPVAPGSVIGLPRASSPVSWGYGRMTCPHPCSLRQHRPPSADIPRTTKRLGRTSDGI